jgi:imidazolonepropionase-like amidohydrolase
MRSTGGIFPDPDFKERGTYLVADIYNDDYIRSEYGQLGFPQKIIDKEKLAKQFFYMVKFGQTPMQAIQAATVNAADLIGNGRIGQLKPGAFADIIAVRTDPLKDFRALENVAFVMKGGVVYKQL